MNCKWEQHPFSIQSYDNTSHYAIEFVTVSSSQLHRCKFKHNVIRTNQATIADYLSINKMHSHLFIMMWHWQILHQYLMISLIISRDGTTTQKMTMKQSFQTLLKYATISSYQKSCVHGESLSSYTFPFLICFLFSILIIP